MISSTHRSQSGAVLVVAMVMLLLLTLIGMAAIRGSTLQERMAGNMRDRNLAFQSAEAALRAGEAVLDGFNIPVFGSVRGYGLPVDDPSNVTFWDNASWWAANGVQTALGLENVRAQPSYYIEEVETLFSADTTGSVEFKDGGPEPVKAYRVTSRATGGSADAVVILQSTYKR